MTPTANTYWAVYQALRKVARTTSQSIGCPQFVAILGLLCACTIATPILPHASAEEEPLTLWQSERKSLEYISKDISSLYISLKRNKLLPTKAYKDEKGRSLQEIMRSMGLFFGKSFPRELDILLCHLNKAVCTIKEETNQTRHAQWTNSAGSTVILPDIAFETYDSPQPYFLKKGEDIRNVVVNIRKGCDSFDTTCEQAILNLNKGDRRILTGDYEGDIVVPTLSVRAFLAINTETPSRPRPEITGTREHSQQSGESPHAGPPGREKVRREELIPLQEFSAMREVQTELPTTANFPERAERYVLRNGPLGRITASAPASLEQHLLIRNHKKSPEGNNLIVDSNNDSLRKELANHLPNGGTITLHGIKTLSERVSAEPQFKEQEGILRTISHPFVLGDDIPDSPSVVAVFDKRVEKDHCEFGNDGGGGQITIANEPPGDGVLNPSASGISSLPSSGKPPELTIPSSELENSATLQLCDQVKQAIPERDHGTHVTGIIGAHINGKGIVGINPNANIYTFEIHPQKVLSPKDATRLADLIYDHAKKRQLDAVNFSWEYQPLQEGFNPIHDRLAKLPNTLFVTSVGNTAADKTLECDVFPACLDLPNVLSVAATGKDMNALWREPNGTDGSNFGSKFHVAAPGVNIIGPIAGGHFGRLSGTSQAASITTGVASLLLAADRKLKPREIKQRLIYTSDLAQPLDTLLLGGIVNASRALLFDVDVVELKHNEKLQGKLWPKDFILYVRTPDSNANHRFSKILRIICADGICKLLLQDTITNLTVDKISEAILARQDTLLHMKVHKDSSNPTCSTKTPCTRHFTLGDIHDYTAALPR